MRNMLKMTLFKKIFLTVFCGLLCVEVIHIYLDYKASIKRITDHQILNLEIRKENNVRLQEYKTGEYGDDLELYKNHLIDITKQYEGYFLMYDKEGNVLLEDANRIKDSSYQTIHFWPKAPVEKWYTNVYKNIDYSSQYFSFDMFDQETLERIKNYILNHREGYISAYLDFEMVDVTGEIEKIQSLRLDDTVIMGHGEKNEYEYILNAYIDDELDYRWAFDTLYYEAYDEPDIQIWVKDEVIEEYRKVYDEDLNNMVRLGYYDDDDMSYVDLGNIESLKLGNDLYIIYYSMYDLRFFDVSQFVNVVKYDGIFENVLEDVLTEKFLAYFVAILISIGASVAISSAVTSRIVKINKVTKEISKRNFENKLAEDSDDELGDLSKSINRMSEDLERTIHELAGENRKIKELELLRKDFINQFTHEMKTPLGVINGYSELIELTEDENEKQRFLMLINHETERINELVLSMLKLSRLEAGKAELNKEDIDLEYLTVNVIDEFEVLLKQKNIKVVINCEDNHITGDKQQLTTVIRNFISNAIKHTDTKIIVTINKGVKVFNEGLPIDEDKLNGIWYTFVTHDKTGTGLGLAICRSILDLHQYQYGVENKENGVEFYFEVQDI